MHEFPHKIANFLGDFHLPYEIPHLRRELVWPVLNWGEGEQTP